MTRGLTPSLARPGYEEHLTKGFASSAAFETNLSQPHKDSKSFSAHTRKLKTLSAAPRYGNWRTLIEVYSPTERPVEGPEQGIPNWNVAAAPIALTGSHDRALEISRACSGRIENDHLWMLRLPHPSLRPQHPPEFGIPFGQLRGDGILRRKGLCLKERLHLSATKKSQPN